MKSFKFSLVLRDRRKGELIMMDRGESVLFEGKKLKEVKFVYFPQLAQGKKELKPIDFKIVLQEYKQPQPLRYLPTLSISQEQEDSSQQERRQLQQAKKAKALQLKRRRERQLDQVNKIRNIFNTGKKPSAPCNDLMEGERVKIKFF